uniref:periphilin-1 n=1 Tax=Scatophagus argus TaxID=75038 RepID=UPI001ED7F43F|nr:periphilin-1 [Scatophagus argus]XP_046251797.1 periphilin-1 [Scatophagus argus]
MSRHSEHGDESFDKKSTDSSTPPTHDEKGPIRRGQSPSRPRISHYHKQKSVVQFHRPRGDHSFYRPGFGHQKHFHFHPRPYFHRRENFHPKFRHIALRDRERDKEKEWYDQRESADGSSPPKQNNNSRAFLPRSSSSRDKDMLIVAQSDRNQSSDRDHRGTKSKDRERSRDGELPSAVSQAVARDRAIQQKRREIDEVYRQECEMFGFVAKMLIAKDQSLEHSIQSSLQENLRDIGRRCLEAMEKFIEDYDSREVSH